MRKAIHMKPETRSLSAVQVETFALESVPVGCRRVILLGPPGVGKGTQARELTKFWGIPHISTGDLLRSHVVRNNSLGRVAKEIMERGKLLSDSLVNNMVAERLQAPEALNGYVLDGFPRTLDQAVWLESRLHNPGQGLPITAISISIGSEELLRRVTGRRNCPLCHTIYNVFMNPPARAGYCDLDGAGLIQRNDDSEETFEARLRAYRDQTAPVVEYYRARGRFAEIDGSEPIETIACRIVASMVRFRQ
jgi:adenylate kinase